MDFIPIRKDSVLADTQERFTLQSTKLQSYTPQPLHLECILPERSYFFMEKVQNNTRRFWSMWTIMLLHSYCRSEYSKLCVTIFKRCLWSSVERWRTVVIKVWTWSATTQIREAVMFKWCSVVSKGPNTVTPALAWHVDTRRDVSSKFIAAAETETHQSRRRFWARVNRSLSFLSWQKWYASVA